MSLRSDEQELICRVSGDAPAGAMMRRYWLPALLSDEVAERDGTPVRIRLLGRNYVAFRDSAGRVGVLDEVCPHRLASLALGRNEEGGLRCIYHGWKFGVDGACLEMPTEPEGSSYKDRMRARAYAVREAGGFVWAYLGPPECEPAFPAYDWTAQPREQIAILKFLENANYLQMLEGAIDSAHTRFLHRGLGVGREEAVRNALSLDLAPRLEAADTTYGFRYNATRKPNVDADRLKYVKITRYVFPTTAVTAGPLSEGFPALTQIFVPVDDEHTMHYSIWHSLDGTALDEPAMRRRWKIEPGVDLDRWWRPLRNADNWWEQDRAAMRNGSYTGIVGAVIQDAAVQESMGAITDHARERLGSSDVAIIRLRRRMRESVRRFLAGEPPIGLEAPIAYDRLTHVPQGAVPIEAPWQDLETYPGEYPADRAVPVG
jgi:phthalate 4,5-dioxygenase oxygenase subunit